LTELPNSWKAKDDPKIQQFPTTKCFVVGTLVSPIMNQPIIPQRVGLKKQR
jgi:hypothetical protein